MRLNRLRKLVPQVRSWRNKRVETSNEPRFLEYHEELLTDHTHHAKTWEGQSMERAEGATPGRRWLKTEKPPT